MVTDDQRREVAARIRELMSECLILPLFVVIAQVINDCLPEEGGPYALILADLIDRPLVHIGVNKHGRAYCPNCGCDDWCIADGSHYCPDCGVELIDD